MSKSTGIIRKMDKLGRVVLPCEIRRSFGWEEGSGIEILPDLDAGEVVLRKAVNRCLNCQSLENLREIFPGIYLCRRCRAKIK